MVTIGGRLSKGCKEQLKTLLKNNMEVFAWEPADMTGKKAGRSHQRVIEWVQAGMSGPVKYRSYISPSVRSRSVKDLGECDRTSKTELRCPKDYYPLHYIDCKVEVAVWVSGTSASWMPTKGIIKSKWQRGRRKDSFLHGQELFVIRKMHVQSKNAGHLQRLVGLGFPSQIGRNLEAYVDDMVIKSKEETGLLADIAETFELKTIT
ncbi:hypothetical protein Tco_0941399 [Tanacetum coccineum]|uniref:Reverse transcriptase domain-containing protein n=1 Tax=Tanacetum coccineum TaxID=301880 RepID=A0ABQ5DWQ4_9ASTR